MLRIIKQKMVSEPSGLITNFINCFIKHSLQYKTMFNNLKASNVSILDTSSHFYKNKFQKANINFRNLYQVPALRVLISESIVFKLHIKKLN